MINLLMINLKIDFKVKFSIEIWQELKIIYLQTHH